MSFPIICHNCNNTEEIASLASLSTCVACGSDDLDINDGEDNTIEAVAEVKTAEKEYFRCGSCGTPGYTQAYKDQYCANCGSSDLQSSDADPDAIRATEEPTDHKASLAKVEAKLQEITAGIIATNPSMTVEAALDVARLTLTKYPKVAGLRA